MGISKILTFIFRKKRDFSVFKPILDLIYPPLCLCCKEMCLTKFLCPFCWELSSPPDPVERCRHCFEELEQIGELCPSCVREPLLPISRGFVFDREAPIKALFHEHIDAIGGFAIYQWLRLDRPIPDLIVPMPDAKSILLARSFAKLLQTPCIKALQSAGGIYQLINRCFEEDLDLLLIDQSNQIESLQKAILVLSETFLKRMFLLSL